MSKSNGITPGPWTTRQAYYTDAHRREGEDWLIESTVANTDIPDLAYTPSIAHMVREADAHLIAAAPDMLVLLNAILTRLDLEYAEYIARGEAPIFICAAMRENIHAVIDKAQKPKENDNV